MVLTEARRKGNTDGCGPASGENVLGWLNDPLIVLIVGGWFPSRPSPRPFDNLPLADVLRGDQIGDVVRAGKD